MQHIKEEKRDASTRRRFKRKNHKYRKNKLSEIIIFILFYTAMYIYSLFFIYWMNRMK